MTHLVSSLAIGLPVFAIVVALVVKVFQITGVKSDVNGLRSEVNTKFDMVLAKFYEHDTEIARLKDKTGLR
jgi:hypothetical protein